MKARQLATRLSWLLPVVALSLLMAVSIVMPASRVRAAGNIVQHQSANAVASTSVSVSFASAATQSNLLIVICSMNAAATITTPSGFTAAIAETGDPAQGIYYKAAAGGESSLTCSFGTSATASIQIYEYTGMHAYTPLDAVSAGGSTGTTGTASTGNVTTTHANDLLIAAVVSDSSTTPGTWANSYVPETNFTVGGSPSKRAAGAGGDTFVFATGTYSTSISVGSGSAWRGQLAAFKQLANTPSQSTDIVDATGATVGTPSASLNTITTSFSCQTVTGSLGTSTQKIHVSNFTDNPAWTLAIAATAGPTASWSYTGPPTRSYKFNDPSGSGCTNGQLTVNASGGTVAAATNCSATSGIAKGSSSAFINGTNNAVTLLSATSPSDVDCSWDLTGISLSQKVPPSQPSGSYSLNMTITITAN